MAINILMTTALAIFLLKFKFFFNFQKIIMFQVYGSLGPSDTF